MSESHSRESSWRERLLRLGLPESSSTLAEGLDNGVDYLANRKNPALAPLRSQLDGLHQTDRLRVQLVPRLLYALRRSDGLDSLPLPRYFALTPQEPLTVSRSSSPKSLGESLLSVAASWERASCSPGAIFNKPDFYPSAFDPLWLRSRSFSHRLTARLCSSRPIVRPEFVTPFPRVHGLAPCGKQLRRVMSLALSRQASQVDELHRRLHGYGMAEGSH